MVHLLSGRRPWASLSFAILMLVPLAAATAVAQQQEGLVNVNIGGDVLSDIAEDLNVDVSQINVPVQVPVGVAANVCGVDANVLAQDKQGAGVAECTATSSSQALTRIIQKQVGGAQSQGAGAGDNGQGNGQGNSKGQTQ